MNQQSLENADTAMTAVGIGTAVAVGAASTIAPEHVAAGRNTCNRWVDKFKKTHLNQPTKGNVQKTEEAEKIKNQLNNKISLATIYNTVHAFERKGYLKQIPINSSQTYFDTNTSSHHHFFDEKEKKLIDLENKDLEPINIKKTIPGKKIKSIEVLIKLDSENS